jgi:hypothetical protein
VCRAKSQSLDARCPPPLPEVLEERRERLLAAGFGLLGTAVFCIAAALNPYDAAGRPLSHGTHRQLGLPPCWVKQVTGLACPSCGMTTSVSLVMHGELAAAWQANPAGAVVAFLGLGVTLWMMAVAAGLRLRRFAVDDVIRWLAVAGATMALARWLATLLAQLGD